MTPARIDTAIRAEFKKWRSKPRPQKDWGLLWVLSGYDTSWNAYSDTRRRLEEGMRLGKKIAKINGRKFPVLYVSGYDEHNTNLKQWHAEDVFEKEYAFPKNNLLIGPQEHIRHTGDQFELFPRRFLKGNKKIVDKIKRDFELYVSFKFENYCKEFLENKFFEEYSSFGKWWYKDNEIDIVALNSEKKKILFGECKWSENIDALEILKKLDEKTKKVNWFLEKRGEEYVLFAKSFKKKLNEFNGKKVYCFDLKDLY